MEGVSQEAASIAGQLGLARLVYVYDDNHITIDGSTTISFVAEDKGKRFEAYGWHVQHVDDPNDLGALRAAFAAARDDEEKPSLIVLRSHIAYPAPHAVDTAKAHGAPLGEDEVRRTKELLGFDPDASFVVPEDVREHMKEVAERGAERVPRGKSAWPPGRRPIQTPRRNGSSTSAGVLATAGSTRCPPSRRGSRSPHATRARR